MIWKEYYAQCTNWDESTQYGRLASITDFGAATSPSVEIVECVKRVRRIAGRGILLRAIDSGVKFTYEQISSLMGMDIYEGGSDVGSLLEAHDGDYTAVELEHLLSDGSHTLEVENLISRICSCPTHFKANEAVSLYEEITDAKLGEKMLMSVDTKFPRSALTELYDWNVGEDILKKLCNQSGVSYAEICDDDDDEGDVTNIEIEFELGKKKKRWF